MLTSQFFILCCCKVFVYSGLGLFQLFCLLIFFGVILSIFKFFPSLVAASSFGTVQDINIAQQFWYFVTTFSMCDRIWSFVLLVWCNQVVFYSLMLINYFTHILYKFTSINYCKLLLNPYTFSPVKYFGYCKLVHCRLRFEQKFWYGAEYNRFLCPRNSHNWSHCSHCITRLHFRYSVRLFTIVVTSVVMGTLCLLPWNA